MPNILTDKSKLRNQCSIVKYVYQRKLLTILKNETVIKMVTGKETNNAAGYHSLVF
jgi:hypothetical protein